MEKINLSRALQIKNRLAEQIASCSGIVQDYNSWQVIPGQSPECSAEEAYKQYVALQAHMVDLKDRISEANRPIQALIYNLAELKGRISLLKGLNTRKGKEISLFSTTPESEYAVYMSKSDVLKEINTLKNEIDKIQNEIERHNFNTNIELSLEWMK